MLCSKQVSFFQQKKAWTISSTFKRDSRHILYRPHLDGRTLFISFMTLAEVDYRAEARGWGATRRADMAVHLRQFAVIDSDRALCRAWAKVRWQVREDGFEIGIPDAWVAATALLYDVPLVTHNRQDYSCVKGLKLISESPF